MSLFCIPPNTNNNTGCLWLITARIVAVDISARLVMCVIMLMVDPPERPTISGYIDGRSVYAGNVLSLTCTSVGGNPPATLTWLKGRHSISIALPVAQISLSVYSGIRRLYCACAESDCYRYIRFMSRALHAYAKIL